VDLPTLGSPTIPALSMGGNLAAAAPTAIAIKIKHSLS